MPEQVTYRIPVFFTSLFIQLSITNRQTRKILTTTYSPIVNLIFKRVPENQRVSIFKKLIPIIQKSAEVPRSRKGTLVLLAEYSQFVLALSQILGTAASKFPVADQILKQIFIADTACDIGDCLIEYRKRTDKASRKEIILRLTALLADYNAAQPAQVTLSTVLTRGRKK